MSDIFFGSSPKPRVSALEWKKLRSNLYGLHHFTTRELEEIEQIFRGSMDEARIADKGIDATEAVKGLQYMRTHMNVHHIPIEKINALEIEIMKYIGTSI